MAYSSGQAASIALLSVGLLAACSSDDAASASGGTTGDGPPPIAPLALPGEAHSHGEPSPLEQALLEEIQRARTNPAGEGERLVALSSVQGAMQQFGVDEQQVIDEFKTYSPVPPLAFDAKLRAAALFHSNDMAVNGFQEHDGSQGEPFYERIEDAGYDYGFCSENIFAYAESIEYCHAGFLIDWGNPDLGHRMTTLDQDGEKLHVGISIVEGPSHPDVGPLVVTQDFAMPLDDGLRYLVGVAFSDADGDGAYDAGEGRAGLSVVPERGTHHAVTSQSGGFAIPFEPGVGQIKVQLQTSDAVVVMEKEATLAGDNVKLDFVVD